jgi:hypothetical protein
MNFCNNLTFYGGMFVSPTLNLQAGGPPLVVCSQLLIQHIRSYPT